MVETRSWDSVDELVTAAAGTDGQLHDALTAIGPRKVADILASEIQVRCPPAGGISDVSVNLVMRGADEQQYPYQVAFKDGQMVVTPGAAEGVLAEIRYTLLDLVRLLYPPREGYTSTSRDVRVVRWPWENQGAGATPPPRPADLAKLSRAQVEQLVRKGQEVSYTLYRAVQAVLTACSSRTPSLDDLSVHYGSDKWGALHWFTQHYERHFASVRHDPVRLLEIGIGGYNFDSVGGQSLYMWQRFFPRGLIYGLDIHAKTGIVGPRIRTIQGDQNDAPFLRELAAEHGPFDIVIDDGSHINEHVRTSFETLFDHVRPGGLYVIEDLHTSYWPALGGELPPGSPSTTMGLLKDLLDRIHYREYSDVDDDEAATANHPSEISVYHNLAFLRKGINNEQGIPKWIRQRGNWQDG